MRKLVDTRREPPRVQRNEDDFAVVRQIAESGKDHPVLMLNMNRYTPDSGFPGRGIYHEYITGLGPFLEGAGGKILWRFPVLGQAVGDQKIYEIIACWYRCIGAFSTCTTPQALLRISPPNGCWANMPS